MQKLAPFLVVNRNCDLFVGRPVLVPVPVKTSPGPDGARALIYGVLISLPFWAVVIWAVWKGWWVK